MDPAMMEMDPDTAYRLWEEGGIFILADVPENIEFGIDMKCWMTGPNFKGVKMIPPGPHYIYYNETKDRENMLSRKGFIHVFKQKEVLVKKWDRQIQSVSVEEMPEDEADRYKNNIISLDQFLGPYPYDVWEKWKSFSNHITENLVQRITPKCGYIQVMTETVPSPDPKKRKRWIKPRTDEERQEDMLPNLVPVEGKEIRFTDFPEERYPQGSSPSEITAHYLDVTYTLYKMLEVYESPLELIGEMQLAFIFTLIGLNLEAFEHWKRLIQLFCSCEKAIPEQPTLYSEFIECLNAQLDEIPIDFLADIVTNDNVVYNSLKEFFRNVNSLISHLNVGFIKNVIDFKHSLSERFGWDFTNLDEEPLDEAPVVVEDVSGV